MKLLSKIAFILVLIGAINWALVGFFKFDLVAILFGEMTMLSRLIYGLVGIAGLYCISFFSKKEFRSAH
ncbi:DUF378 domain-containing protein [Clostridium sp. SHJSY1]|uniref:DUF378 domain-containing protein n=1 Tax=Clostridium sp. SHJSY1 TaxID=2942483 RepID=UPI002876E5E0|nr:DUF378 domain-containing protein [Clostridium sp. SHJSY1]MDS0524730.1 DUF378 domain-containing protein [Clostridium sp. SHJSY1]